MAGPGAVPARETSGFAVNPMGELDADDDDDDDVLEESDELDVDDDDPPLTPLVFPTSQRHPDTRSASATADAKMRGEFMSCLKDFADPVAKIAS